MKLNHNKISCIKLVHLLYLYIWCTVTLISDLPLTQRPSGILKKLKRYSSLCSSSFFVILLFLHLRDLCLSLLYSLFFLFYLFVFVLSFFLIYLLFLVLFSLLFLLFLILFTSLVYLSFLKSYTKCLLWLYLTDWLKLWSAVDNRTILELYQWSIFIVIIEWLNGYDNRNSL